MSSRLAWQLATVVGLAGMAGCPVPECVGAGVQGEQRVSGVQGEQRVSGVRIRFVTPAELPLRKLRGDSPDYDLEAGLLSVVLENVSGSDLTLPLPEIRDQLALSYQDPASGRSAMDDRTPPPRRDGKVETLAAGAAAELRVQFDLGVAGRVGELPADGAPLRVCARWERDWLREEDYAEGAFTWAESFEVCNPIRLVGD